MSGPLISDVAGSEKLIGSAFRNALKRRAARSPGPSPGPTAGPRRRPTRWRAACRRARTPSRRRRPAVRPAGGAVHPGSTCGRRTRPRSVSRPRRSRSARRLPSAEKARCVAPPLPTSNLSVSFPVIGSMTRTALPELRANADLPNSRIQELGIGPLICRSSRQIHSSILQSGNPLVIAFVAGAGSKASGSNSPPTHSSITSYCSLSEF